MTTTSAPLLLHASTVDVDGKGVLIVGGSGRGKSALALELMAFGATLVSDDCTEIYTSSSGCVAKAPARISHMIEARGVGLLHAEAIAETILHLVVDLDQTEDDRLPSPHVYKIGALELPCLRRISAPHFGPAILQMMRAGRVEVK